jgi:SAM-dependent methyltransferase
VTLRTLERESIRAFVEQAGAGGYLRGRVLDFGCGEAPYRALVQSFGCKWVGFDREHFPGSVAGDVGEGNPLRHRWDAILVSQVLQYERFPRDMLNALAGALRPGGHLIVVGPTAWPEVEVVDLWRFTQAGIRCLLEDAGLAVISIAPRAYHRGEPSLSLGFGAIARA